MGGGAESAVTGIGESYTCERCGGTFTKTISDSRVSAEAERAGCEQDCGSCDGGTHTLVMRDRQQWRAP